MLNQLINIGWKVVPISDVMFFQEGPGVRKFQFRQTGVKLLNVGNINNKVINLAATKVYISEEEAYGKYAHFLVKEGDLLIACSGIIISKFHKKIAFAKKEHLPLCLNTSTMRFRALDNEVVHLNYFKFFLQTRLFTEQLRKLITGSAQLNFGPSHVKKMKVPLPPLSEQKRIAAILDKAEEVKRHTKALIKKYEELTQSLFLEMFGDVVKNPKGWEEKKFAEVGKLDRGKSKHRPRNAPELLNGPYPLVQTGDVSRCKGYIKKYNSTYSEIGLRQSKMWKKGTLCITIAANIAKTGILTFDACFPDSIVGFIPNKMTTNIYVQYWLSFLQKILEDKAPESAQKNINLRILRSLDIPIPPIKLQNQFAKRVEAIEAQKAAAEASLAKAEDLFNCLLQKAFKGELGS